MNDEVETSDTHPYPRVHPSVDCTEGWKADIDAKGPIGLLVHSIKRFGGRLNSKLEISQSKEHARRIDTPYQFLGELLVSASRRALTRAASRTRSFKRMMHEVDYDVMRTASKHLNRDDRGFLNLLRSGGGYTGNILSRFNSEAKCICEHCGVQCDSIDHVIWGCPQFVSKRTEVDPELATLNSKHLHPAVRSGVALALTAILWSYFLGAKQSRRGTIYGRSGRETANAATGDP